MNGLGNMQLSRIVAGSSKKLFAVFVDGSIHEGEMITWINIIVAY